MSEELVWNVYITNVNAKKIEPYNVFKSSRIVDGIKEERKNFIKEYEKHITLISGNNMDTVNEYMSVVYWKLEYKDKVFEENIRRLFSWAYSGRVEYEITIAEYPAHISKEELERASKGDFKYVTAVDLDIQEKINIYNQLQLNWDKFVDYIWDSMKYIKM